jgi:hypothetical protein
MSDDSEPQFHMPLYQLLTQIYGPYAFGMVSLLVVWVSIVKPELQSRSIDWQANQAIMERQAEIVDGLSETSRNVRDTAASLERVRKYESVALESDRNP